MLRWIHPFPFLSLVPLRSLQSIGFTFLPPDFPVRKSTTTEPTNQAPSMSTKHPIVSLAKETPCGCVQQAGEGGGGAVCSGACCGEGCRCAQLKGKCDCAERLQANETTAMGQEERVPKGCIVEAGVTEGEACGVCGVKGCHCMELKGRCDCVDA